MNHTPQQGGATVHAHGRIPSTDLASLVALLVEALPPQQRSAHVFSWPAVTFDAHNRRLVLNTYGVLRRLVVTPEFRKRFRQSDTSGFLRDLLPPPRGFTAKTGGKIFEDNLKAVSDGVTALKKALVREFEQLGTRPEELLITNAPEVLAGFASELGARDFGKPLPAQLVPIEFAKSDRPASAREQDVARVISAEEDIQAEDWLERMASAIAQLQTSRDEEFDDSQRDKLVETLRQDARKSDSQVSRFLNFLEDEALARVRLEVSFAIMEALAVQVGNKQDADELAFVNYIHRVITLFKLYGSPEAEDSLDLDLSRDYGLNASFTVSGEWVKAMFYNCLPVWAEWNTQLFESRRVDPASGGVSIVREVSYRFRVNGHDPKNERLHAFDSRLTRQRQILVDEADEPTPNPYRLRRNLAEIVFLWLVLNPELAEQDLQHAAEELTQRLNREGKAGVEHVLQELGEWSERVIHLSKTLVALLRSKSRQVIAHAQRMVDDLYVVVQEGIVDWAAIERSRGKARDPLVIARRRHGGACRVVQARQDCPAAGGCPRQSLLCSRPYLSQGTHAGQRGGRSALNADRAGTACRVAECLLASDSSR